MNRSKLLVYSLFIFSILPIFIFANIEFLEGINDNKLLFEFYSGYVASIVGLIGTTLLVWMMILGSRGLVKYISKDWIWIMQLHKTIGIYGFLLILMHPIFILFSYSESIRFLFVGDKLPSDEGFTEFDQSVILGRIALYILAFVWITSAILRKKLGFRPWKYLHYLSYLIPPIVFAHASAIGSQINSSDGIQFYFYFLVAIYFLVILYRLLYQVGFDRYRYRIKEIKEITYDINEYIFEPVSKRFIKPLIGQFVYIQTKLFGEFHPYTVAKFNKQSGHLSLSVKSLGKFSKGLTALKQGDIVLLDGPYGVFTQEAFDSQKPIVIIAGGIGVTPFLELVKKIRESKREVAMFYGNKSKKDIAYGDYLKKYLGENLIHVLSDVKEKSKDYESGFIDERILNQYLKAPFSKYKFFVCGPPIMMEKLNELLLEKSVSKEDIHMEKFAI